MVRHAKYNCTSHRMGPSNYLVWRGDTGLRSLCGGHVGELAIMDYISESLPNGEAQLGFHDSNDIKHYLLFNIN